VQVLPNWIVQSVIGSIQLHRSSDGRYISAELYLMVLEIFHGRSPSMLSSVHDLQTLQKLSFTWWLRAPRVNSALISSYVVEGSFRGPRGLTNTTMSVSH
jgi:hypothetical protein